MWRMPKSVLTLSSIATTLLLVLFSFSCLECVRAERDFNFNDSQVPLLEPRDEPAHINYGDDPYSVELSNCRLEKNELVLSLVLKSHDWTNFSDNKKDKVLEKLSKFFAIPKEFIVIDSATKRDFNEMQKESLRRGYFKCHNSSSHSLGRVSFVLGCGSKYFTMSEPIKMQIGAQMKDGSIDNITGEKFGWWVIWRKHYKQKALRVRRQTEGSGAEDVDDDYDYEYGDDDEDVVENVTDVPVTTHAHRHHHGVDQSNIEDYKMEITSVSSSSTLSNKIVDPVIDAEVRGEEGILAAVSAASSSPKQTSLISNSNLLPTNKAGNIDKEIVESVSQLESVITKTIENTKNIKEIPVIEEDDVPVVVEIEKELDLSNAIEELNREKAEKTNLKENDQVNPIVANEPVKLTNSTTETSSHSLNEYVAVENNTYETSSDVNVDTSTAGSYKLKEFVNMNASTSPSPEVEVVTLLPVSISLEPGISTANSFAIEVGKLETTSLLPSTLYTLSMNAAITVSTTPTPIQLTNAVTTSLYSSPATVSSSSSSYSSMSVSPSTTSSDSSFVPPFISSTVTTSLATTTSSIQTPMLTKDDNETDVTASVNGSSQTPFITPQVKDVNSSSPTTALNSPTTSAYATTPTTLSSETNVPTVTSTDYVEPKVENTPPMIRTRLQKFAVTSGKAFTYSVPADTFYDTEDLTNLRLDLTDKDGRELKASSWLQFNPETHVLYGLPLDDSVSKWQYRLSATDSGNESVTETLEISVQQHRGVRTVNHEISITVRINEKNMHNIDWQLKLMRDVALTLGDENTSWIVVREIRAMPQDPNTATFVYFNETFPTSECPEGGLNKLVKSLDASRLSDLIYPTLSVKSITGQLIGACQKSHITKPKPTTHMATNVPPLPRNQVDRVNATVGHLLVFKVPSDTFYDPNDNEQLSLTLKTKDHKELNPRHWLQFDSKNQEFYGIPKSGDTGSEEYLLVAQDAGGLSATDALVVVVNHAPKKEFSVYFKAYLAIRHEQFNADLQRKFVERIAQLFGDSSTQYVQIRSVTTHHDSDSTIVNFYNTSLYKSHNRCPEEEIEAVRSVYLIKDHMVRDHVKKILGPELNLTNVQALPLGLCHPQTDIIHRDYAPVKPDQPTLKSSFSDEYMYTIILPAIIIVTMILIALMVACCLHRRRRKSGKMELGDEEERRSFRKKNIPVIFQDELDEKPEIGNKSPIILKDEKPPLLPPSYNTSNMNGDNDVDEYVPPPAVVVGGREARGKSPATPSYRKPPPYVSP
uniref:Dystroglycan 1 n=1 Tax=Ceratitis capitata TaxID=7213 RepID=W8AT05_CERCA